MERKNSAIYYSRRELIHEIAERNNWNYYDVSDIINDLYNLIIEKFASGDNVEIGLFPGLKLTCRLEPIQKFKLHSVVHSHYDYILNVGLKTTQLLKKKIRERR